MAPFQQFRWWSRHASPGEKATSALASAAAVAALVWAMVPATSSTVSAVSSGNSSQTARSVAAVSPGSNASGTAGGSGAEAAAGTVSAVAGVDNSTAGAGAIGPGPTRSGSTGQTGPGCTAPPGTDAGVSNRQIKVAFILVAAGGAAVNSTFGVPSPSVQQQDYQYAVDAVNASGGVACSYKLSPLFYQANSFDQTSLQQMCLNIEGAGVFAVIDFGGYFLYPSLASCYPDNHIVYLSNANLPVSEQQQKYPYMFSTASSMEDLYKDTVFALGRRGFFSASNGFQKLGFIYRSCVSEEPGEFTNWLHQVGVSSSQIVPFDVGCPTPFADPGTLESAVLKFEQNGVTHVTELQDSADFANFTNIAQQQHFNPKYGLPDDSIVAITNSTQHPDYNNLANALAIETARYGEDNTPGFSPTAATIKCNSIFQAHGQPPVYKQQLGMGGIACNDVWMLAGALDHAPVLQHAALAAGLQAAKSIDFSFPYGPNDFSAPRVTTGGEFWRTLQFMPSCTCWQIIDPIFRPHF